MALQTIQKIQPTGLVPALAAADGAGDTVQMAGHSGATIFVYVENTDTAAHDVIVIDQNSKAPVGADAFDADLTVNVAAGDTAMVGPISASRFADADGLIHLDWSAITGMNFAVIRL